MRKKDKKALPIGNSDFKDIIEKKSFYVDKTELIEDVLYKNATVSLFTRPRRFGKTLNMSMLKYFFDVKNAKENRKLFDNLYISKTKYMEKQGQNPVIFFTFKEFNEKDWENGFRMVKNVIAWLYNEFSFLKENLNERELAIFNKIWLMEDGAEWKNSIKILSKYLYKYYGKKVVILVDEYDQAILAAHLNGYYKEAVNFFKTFFGAALKDNEYLELGVMTGILRVAKEGIFSGLNHVKMNTIFQNMYSEYFGLTEDEVEKALEYYDETAKIEEVRKWYNGYLFGETKIYNTWSIINFLDEGKLKAYWINTSGNDLIIKYLRKAKESIIEDLERLFNGKSITKFISETVDFNELESNFEDEIWRLFLYSGYLTTADNDVENELYDLKIPNKEIFSFFEKSFIINNVSSYDKFVLLSSFLEKGEIEKFGAELEKILKISASFYDYSGNEKEQFYHGLVLGLIAFLQEKYIITSNRESGKGRYDLVLEPRKGMQNLNKNNTGFIFEFKLSDKTENLEKDVKEAIIQIEEKKYETDLRNRGIENIIKIGIAFCGSEMKIKND